MAAWCRDGAASAPPLLPTLRLGFVVTPPSLRAAVHKAKHVTDWHSHHHPLTRQFADHLEVIPSAVGLHVAAVAPKASPERIGAVVGRASEVGVVVQELSRFAVDGARWAGLLLG